jgi:RNA polymerase sigma factor (sigma-70 family)
MEAVTGEAARLKSSLLYLARRKFRISRDAAEDLVQSALLTYLEVRHRYPRSEEHARILVGIFRNKCREHIERCVRTARGMHALRSTLATKADRVAAARPESTMAGGVLGEIVQHEDGRRILRALSQLRPQASEMFRLITEEGVSRRELMRRYGLNANTLDSRLHAYRKELRALLDRRRNHG